MLTICGNNQNEQRFLEAVTKYNLTLNLEKSKFSLRRIKLLGYLFENKTIRPAPELQPLLQLPVSDSNFSLKRALGMFSHYAK